MKGYLKGYYGYKNFGDELLLLGLIKYLEGHDNIEELVIESGDKNWLQSRVQQNRKWLGKTMPKILYNQISHSLFDKIKSFLKDKYFSYHKFFGGGEVLNPERSFPHDGWNLYIGHRLWKKKRSYTLLGGIGKINRKRDNRLYQRLLPYASKIILRDPYSYKIVKDFLTQNKSSVDNSQVILYEDFSTPILQEAKKQMSQHIKYVYPNDPYICINLNSASYTSDNIRKIITYSKQYSHHKIIFFPCDMNDDAGLFNKLKKKIPLLEYYDRTQHSLGDTLALLYHAKAGIGARLHFLYPLKYFGIPLEAIPYKDKVNKLIIQDTKKDEKLK